MLAFPTIKFRHKIILLGIASVLLTAFILLLVTYWQTGQYNRKVQQNVDELTGVNLENLVKSAYNLVEAQGESVQKQVDSHLNVANYVLQQSGTINLSPEQTSWTAVNQVTLQGTQVQLPKMLLNGQWLGQNTDVEVNSPIVDQVTSLVGGTATIFQRMNAEGDMLRVATNVQSSDETRAIGTYISATRPDGQPDPVITSVLKGETYHGVAFVVNTWYVTAYQPLFDEQGEIVGMLYVGVKQENITSLRQALREMRIGRIGTFYVLSGEGDQQGKYIISPDGLHDRQVVWNIQDAAGGYLVQEIISTASRLGPDEVAKIRYPWLEQNMASPEYKLAYVTYYQPWNWVIVAEVYESEVLEYAHTLQEGRDSMRRSTLAAVGGIVLLVGALCTLLARSLALPLDHLANTATRIAAGDLTLAAKVEGNDEISTLARAFNGMTARLREKIEYEEARSGRLRDTIHKYASHMSQVAQGNLTSRLTLQENGDDPNDPLIVLGRQLNETTASLHEMISETRRGADDLFQASSEILFASTQQATGAAEQSAAISQISTTVDQFRIIAQQASERALQVQENSQHTLEISHAGKTAVQNAISSMEQIERQVKSIAENIVALSGQMKQIGDIIASVNDIASQSNFLALNASIEAARAGEGGKGFSVVAGEVRTLAGQSKEATRQVKEILTEILKITHTTVSVTQEGSHEVAQGANRAAEARHSIDRLAQVIDESAQMAVTVVAGGQQQLNGIEQIATSMKNINQVTVQSLASTRQAEKSAQNLMELANNMTETVKRYQV